MTSIYHGEETLITQQKGGQIKTWNICKNGYQVDATIDTNHIGFCRFQYVPEDNLLIAPSNDNEICIYNMKTSEVQSLNSDNSSKDDEKREMKLGQIMCFQHFRFSDQFYILAGYESGAFLTWDLRKNKIINEAKFEECPMSLDFSPEANRGIYGNSSDKLGIFGYSRNDMKLINRGDIAVKNPGTNCIRIRKDRKIFCSGGWDGRIRIFSWKSLRPLTVLTDHKAAITDIAYSDRKIDLWHSPIMATSGADGQISLWNLYN